MSSVATKQREHVAWFDSSPEPSEKLPVSAPSALPPFQNWI
jgi:hypothetical protein